MAGVGGRPLRPRPGSDTNAVPGGLRRRQSAPPEDRGDRAARAGRPHPNPPANPAVPVLRAAHSQGRREVPPLRDVATIAMTMLALLGFAALTFSILAGVINGLSTRRPRRRLQEKPSPVLHPLTHHGRPRGRHPRSWRALHHVGLFLGFLLATYVGLVVLRVVYRAVVD